MDSPQIRRIPMGEDQIRAMARRSRDFILKVTEAGDVTAQCKACGVGLKITRDGDLLWFYCPSCGRQSFYPIGNVERDHHFAGQDGRPFISELYYMRKLPPGLKSPFSAEVPDAPRDGA